MNSAKRHLFAFVLIPLLILGVGCSERDPTGLELARATINPLVFDDDYDEDAYYQAFAETHLTAVELDSVYAYNGSAEDGARSLKFNIPPEGSALGLYTGGVITSGAKRDMADFNALTFYARSDEEVGLDVVGFGNDNTGTSLYEAGRSGIPLTGEWTFVVVPIPAPSKLISERGLLTFAESLEQQHPKGYNIWLDEIRFARLGNIEFFRANMRSVNRQYFVGSTVTVENTSTIFQIDGGFVPVGHSPNYFDYVSDDPSVAEVDRGTITIVGEGQAVVTATVTVDSLPVNGSLTLTGLLPPTEAAPTPTVPAANVISLFSDVYDDVPVDTWRADWSRGGNLKEYVVDGSNIKEYSSLTFVGIIFESVKIDATEMTHFHLDVYAPAGTDFRVKLVSFPPELENSVETGELILDASTTPAFTAGSWSSLDIPLSDFTLPEFWDAAHIGQLVLATTTAKLVLVDNVYFRK